MGRSVVVSGVVVATALLLACVQCAPSFGGMFESFLDDTTYTPDIQCENINLMTGKCNCPSWTTGPQIAARIINDGSGGQQDGGYLWECYGSSGPYLASGWGGSYQKDDDVTGGHGCRYPNPYTSSCSCPLGFTGITVRVLDDTQNFGSIIGSHITFCWADPSSSESYAFGGVYQALDDGTCLTTNPSTSSCSCSDRFSIHQTIRTLVDYKSGSYSPGAIHVCERGVATMINVHAIPHTHDDVGWLETVDGYYDCCVNNIITTMVDSLTSDANRRFTYVEMAFFNKWWVQQSEDTQAVVKQLVNQGRLDFTIGGWCMPDEASPTYTDMVDQMTAGHLFLKETFGEAYVPTVGWQIDPFGHSQGNTWLYKKFGFDFNVVMRIDHQDDAYRTTNRDLEFIWRPMKSFEAADQDIMSHILWDWYCWPSGRSVSSGFSWTSNSTDADRALLHQKHDNLRSTVSWDPDQFAFWIYNYAGAYQSNEAIAPMGCDFEWQSSEGEFEGLDNLIGYFDEHPEYGLNMFYSTPTKYKEALATYTSLTFPVKTDDFFGYADYTDDYWSGYFTSHPAFKRHIRSSSSLFHAARLIHALASGDVSIAEDELTTMWHAVGVVQHHDSITGTSKSFVYDDYNSQLDAGNVASQSAILESLSTIFPQFSSGWSVCDVPQEESAYCSELAAGTVISVYNPLAYELDIPLTLGVESAMWVVASNGSMLRSQTRLLNGAYELTFVAPSVPPLGIATFQLRESDEPIAENKPYLPGGPTLSVSIENSFYVMNFDSSTGYPTSLYDKIRGLTLSLSVDVLYYVPENSPSNPRSGAYVFAANTPASNFPGPRFGVTTVMGSVYEELDVFLDKSSHIAQRYRLYNSLPFVEITTTVGPIDVSDGYGKEVIVRYTSDMQSGGLLYTDSHGLEFAERVYNVISNQFEVENPISGNFYPVSTAGYITDKKSTMAVLPDRGQGIASLTNGTVELMVHRRLLTDGDQKGVGEPLDDATAIGTKHLLVYDSATTAAAKIRQSALKYEHPAVVLVSSDPVAVWPEWTPMVTALPENIHLLTLQVTQYNIADGAQILLRLHHIMAVDEDPTLSEPVTLDLQKLFADWTITAASEMTLSGAHTLSTLNIGPSIPITIDPMDIRTFAIKMQ